MTIPNRMLQKVVLATLVLGACTREVMYTMPVAEITLAPGELALDVGASAALSPAMFDHRQRVLYDHSVSWSTEAASIATVDAEGVVRAISPGTTRILATSGDATGYATLSVRALARLQASPSAVDATIAKGATAQRDLLIESDRPLANGDLTAVASPGASWITVLSAGSTTPATIRVKISTAGLAVGDHEATVALQATGAEPFDVPVRVRVAAAGQPLIVVTPASMGFVLTEGVTQSETLTAAIQGAAGLGVSGLAATIEYPDGAPTDWLDLSLSATETPATLTARATAASLVAGAYQATIRLAGTGAPSFALPVSVEVQTAGGQGDPLLRFTSPEIVFSAEQGGAPPPAATVGVFNGGGGSITDLDVSIEYNGADGWLSAALASTSTPTSLVISADPTGLPLGTQAAWIRVASSAGTGTLPVRIDIEAGADGPSIVVDASSIVFQGEAGGGDPDPVGLLIENGGGGSLESLGVSVEYDDGQPTGWLGASLGSAAAPTTLTASASVTGLDAGTYGATIHISAPGVTPVAIDASLEVLPLGTPIIDVDVPDVLLEGEVGGGDPADVGITITNGGGGVLADVAASISFGEGEPDGWLDATLSATTAPATLTLAATIGALPAGTYHAEVEINASLASTRTVSVVLEIGAGAPIIGISLPAPLAFAGTVGGVVLPGSLSVPILNLGGGSLIELAADVEYADGQPQGWLDFDLTVGVLAANLSVQTSASGLGAGTYDATVHLSVAGAATVDVDVVLVLLPALGPVIGLSLLDIEFDGIAGGVNPVPQMVVVTNVGIGLLLGLNAEIQYADGEPTGWLEADLSGGLPPANLQVSAALGGLGAGQYHARIVVSGLLVSEVAIDVILTVSEPPPPPDGLD